MALKACESAGLGPGPARLGLVTLRSVSSEWLEGQTRNAFELQGYVASLDEGCRLECDHRRYEEARGVLPFHRPERRYLMIAATERIRTTSSQISPIAPIAHIIPGSMPSIMSDVIRRASEGCGR